VAEGPYRQVAFNRVESYSVPDFVNRQDTVLNQVRDSPNREVISIGHLFGCFPGLSLHSLAPFVPGRIGLVKPLVEAEGPTKRARRTAANSSLARRLSPTPEVPRRRLMTVCCPTRIADFKCDLAVGCTARATHCYEPRPGTVRRDLPFDETLLAKPT